MASSMSGLGKKRSSLAMPAAGVMTRVPTGSSVPSERAMGFLTLRAKETANLLSLCSQIVKADETQAVLTNVAV